VQGVGYRNFVQRKAVKLGLSGYVMNLRDGRVRVRVEGVREAIEELTRDLTKGPPLSRVENMDVTWRPPTGKFTAFVVRYAEFDS
jgi:acylphosphatase